MFFKQKNVYKSLKKLLKEACEEKTEYAKEVEVLREKVVGLERNIKIICMLKSLDNGN